MNYAYSFFTQQNVRRITKPVVRLMGVKAAQISKGSEKGKLTNAWNFSFKMLNVWAPELSYGYQKVIQKYCLRCLMGVCFCLAINLQSQLRILS